MQIPVDVLESELLALPVAERARLLDRVIASLDADPELQESWVREAARREAEINSGASALVDGDAAIARLKANLQ